MLNILLKYKLIDAPKLSHYVFTVNFLWVNAINKVLNPRF